MKKICNKKVYDYINLGFLKILKSIGDQLSLLSHQ